MTVAPERRTSGRPSRRRSSLTVTIRLHDNWVHRIRGKQLSFQARWHLLEMVHFSLVSGFDTSMRRIDAIRCSDAEDPDECLRELLDAGLVAEVESGYQVVRLREYGPVRVIKDDIPGWLREAVLARDGHRCLACGCHDGLTCDHVVPEALGGKTELDNMQALCKPCNSSKGIKVIDYRSA